jgi:hypothetical protein
MKLEQDSFNQLLAFQAETAMILPEPIDSFAPVLAQLGENPDLLLHASTILQSTHHIGCALQCFERITAIAPEETRAWLGIINCLLGLHRHEEMLALVSRLIDERGYIISFEDICNQALWFGKHAHVADFLKTNAHILAHYSLADPNLLDAPFSYACEADPALFDILCEQHLRITGQQYPYREQSFLPCLPNETEFLFASFCYSGTSAFINFLMLIGVRVDETGRHFGEGTLITENTELRKYINDPSDELPARVLLRNFPFRRGVRCYSFSHRLPNPALVVGRPCLFLIRDPRVALNTWAKPTRQHLESGAFARFVASKAHQWCNFIDGIEQIPMRLVVRFEDWQADPMGVAEAIIKHFGLQVRHSELEEAIYYSGTQIARQIREAVQQMKGEAPTTATRSIADPNIIKREYELIEKICGERLWRYRYT